MIKYSNLQYVKSELTDEQNKRTLQQDKLVFATKPVATKDALSGEEPFEWADDVINGDRKVNL